jgi:hypothetical protein
VLGSAKVRNPPFGKVAALGAKRTFLLGAANDRSEPKIPDAADSSDVLSSQVTSSKSSIRS